MSSFRQSVFNIFRQTYPYKLFYIRNRMELPIILNKRGLTKQGVEVGVWKAEYSNFLLEKWKGKVLYSVDPWKNFSTDNYIDDMNISQSEFDKIYADVKQLLAKYGDKSKIIRDLSVEAAQSFQNNTLDFVYLDGRHNYDGVKEDIESWYPKVKSQGLICGHDYLDGMIGKTDFGVKKAVDEFAISKNLKTLVTHKDDYPSWFIIKP